jgi:hypothetical protein
MTYHFLITATNGDGDNLDLIVECQEYATALLLWREHYNPEAGGLGGLDAEGVEVTGCWLLPPLTGQPHALAWHDDVKDTL